LPKTWERRHPACISFLRAGWKPALPGKTYSKGRVYSRGRVPSLRMDLFNWFFPVPLESSIVIEGDLHRGCGIAQIRCKS
ncbi:MAG: hypothetical protein WCG29_14525, partial [Desulfomonile sp.]